MKIIIRAIAFIGLGIISQIVTIPLPAQSVAEQNRYNREIAERNARALASTEKQWIDKHHLTVFFDLSRFEKNGAWGSVTIAHLENVGHHNESLNVVQDYEWVEGPRLNGQFFIEGKFASDAITGQRIRLDVYSVGATIQVGALRYTKLFTDPVQAKAFWLSKDIK